MSPIFRPLDNDTVAALRSGGPDAYGMVPERVISDGSGNPCRHCLRDIEKGEDMLILAHRPFPALQPYAETGPIFLCAACEGAEPDYALPPVVAVRQEFLVKPYGRDHRIHTVGEIVPTMDMQDHCDQLLSDETVAYVDLRSAVNNCFICRVTRSDCTAGEDAG
ncbi:MAG: DUF1203 domain-containing protein [Pseudomonadota bacterium]